jgi:hypothetical protein
MERAQIMAVAILGCLGLTACERSDMPASQGTAENPQSAGSAGWAMGDTAVTIKVIQLSPSK